MRFSLSPEPAELRQIVRARGTDEETLAACVEAAHRMGQNATVIEETPQAGASIGE
jgi:3-hydroxyacyl-CoA dehydrogenase